MKREIDGCEEGFVNRRPRVQVPKAAPKRRVRVRNFGWCGSARALRGRRHQAGNVFLSDRRPFERGASRGIARVCSMSTGWSGWRNALARAHGEARS